MNHNSLNLRIWSFSVCFKILESFGGFNESYSSFEDQFVSDSIIYFTTINHNSCQVIVRLIYYFWIDNTRDAIHQGYAKAGEARTARKVVFYSFIFNSTCANWAWTIEIMIKAVGPQITQFHSKLSKKGHPVVVTNKEAMGFFQGIKCFCRVIFLFLIWVTLTISGLPDVRV